jgi:hypothetical protein
MRTQNFSVKSVFRLVYAKMTSTMTRVPVSGERSTSTPVNEVRAFRKCGRPPLLRAHLIADDRDHGLLKSVWQLFVTLKVRK